MTMCNHKVVVDGFGAMGDAWVCVFCGLSKYPEVFPAAGIFGTRIVIPDEHPLSKEWAALAVAAMNMRATKEREV